MPVRARYISTTSLPGALEGLKMTRPPELVREFIQDCLYNERDGYFQRHVNIFSTTRAPLNFNAIRDQEDYNNQLYKMYQEQTIHRKFYQLWHTPSELFCPWFGMGIANYICQKVVTPPPLVVSSSSPSLKSNEPLIIYEIGPGNGSLCEDICNFIKSHHPLLYNRLEYNLVEISHHLIESRLLELQKRHPLKIHIHNRSFLDWKRIEPRPVFVLAMEMFDNLPQDRVRFADDGTLEQAMVITNDSARYMDQQSHYTEVFLPATDPLIIDTVNALEAAGKSWPSLHRNLLDSLFKMWPLSTFKINRPWNSEFIPTGPFKFLKNLSEYFPKHSLIMSDFDTLPDPIKGYGAPVVQTRYEGDTISCSTFLLKRGLFDIFFPLDFNLLAKVTQNLSHRPVNVIKHDKFCKEYMNTSMTETRSGFNPMLEDFANVSFLITS